MEDSQKTKAPKALNILGAIGVAVIGICISVVIMMGTCGRGPSTTSVESYPLEALADDNETDGSFIMMLGFGFGQIKETMKYRFYYNDHGDIVMKELDVNKVVIRYKDTPSYEIETTLTPEKVTDWCICRGGCSITKHILNIPVGSIVKQFNLDLQ